MLRFQTPKALSAWLRTPAGRRVRDQCVSDVESSWVEAEPRFAESSFALKPRVLIVTEGTSVSVYVDGEVIVRHVDRPVCRSVAANDLADELLAKEIGPWWDRLKRRMTFWTNTRSLRERDYDLALIELSRFGPVFDAAVSEV